MNPVLPPHHAARPTRTRRAGFTLLELLAVIAIMAVLLSLLIGVSLQFVENARAAATRATLMKVDGMLQRRRSAVQRSVETGQINLSQAGARGSTPLGLKITELVAMPGYLRFVPDPDNAGASLAVLEGYDVGVTSGTIQEKGVAAGRANRDDPATSSAEALHFFLTEGAGFGVEDTDRAAFTPSETADADGDGFPELIDGWGRPLRFYRWPTRLVRPSPVASPHRPTKRQTVAGRSPDRTVTCRCRPSRCWAADCRRVTRM